MNSNTKNHKRPEDNRMDGKIDRHIILILRGFVTIDVNPHALRAIKGRAL